jgi:long-chain acyl-CoA synthetase
MIKTIKSIFEQNADRTFIVESQTSRQISYASFLQMAGQMAIALRQHGIGKSDRVAILLSNSVEFAALYFACLFTGAEAVPINPILHQREIMLIIGQVKAKLIVYCPSTKKLSDTYVEKPCRKMALLPLVEQNQNNVNEKDYLTFDAMQMVKYPVCQLLDDVRQEDVFTINFTSGTTSMPKGVVHRIDSLFGNAAAFNKDYGISREHRFFHVLPMSYMAGFLNTLICPFMAGASIVLARQFDAQSAIMFWEPAIQHEANTFWLTPTMLSILLYIDRNKDGIEYCHRHVKKLFVGTAPLPLKVKDDFEKKYGIEVFESYGLSELLLISANSEIHRRKEGSVGRILKGVEIRVCNEGNFFLPRGESGEILVQTPYMTVGYLDHQTGDTISLSHNSWFSTGDIGYCDADGDLFITGRKKDLIIRGGFNISPRGVEDIILLHPSVEQVAVIGLPHELQGEEVAAIIQFKPGRTLALERDSIDSLCKQELSPHSVPTKYLSIDKFPMSSSGKIQKSKLREIAMVSERSHHQS